MAVIARNTRRLPSCGGPSPSGIEFGVVIGTTGLGIEELRAHASELHPKRPLFDGLDGRAAHLVATVRERGRLRLVGAARITSYRPRSSFYALVTGQDKLPACIMASERIAEFSWLVVAKKFRGSGIGTALVVQTLELLQKLNFQTLIGVLQIGMPKGEPYPAELAGQIEGVRRMYERLGFVIHDKVRAVPALDSGVPLIPFSFDISEFKDLALEKWGALNSRIQFIEPSPFVGGFPTSCPFDHSVEGRGA